MTLPDTYKKLAITWDFQPESKDVESLESYCRVWLNSLFIAPRIKMLFSSKYLKRNRPDTIYPCIVYEIHIPQHDIILLTKWLPSLKVNEVDFWCGIRDDGGYKTEVKSASTLMAADEATKMLLEIIDKKKEEKGN